MSEPVRLIKKYPNRRLYDTKTSAYITLGDVKDLVIKFEPFKVADAKTGEDLTRSILLQIILEEESGGVPLFTSELLSGFIRFYGSAMQGMLGKYLENNMRTFVDFQQKLQEQSRLPIPFISARLRRPAHQGKPRPDGVGRGLESVAVQQSHEAPDA